MDPHAPRPDAKRHKDVSYLLEHYGGERVWVCTTGLATGDFPWPALTVPKPRHLFLPKEFHAPAYADSHVAVMLLGVGDTRRHSEFRWFRYARAEHITAFSKAQFERWLPPFCARLVQAGARSGDPLVAADGLAAAFRMVDKFESRMVTCPLDPSLVHEARQLRLSFLDAARAAAEASAARALGSRDFLESLLSATRGGAQGFLAARNVSLEHVQYDFSSERALLGEESGLPQPSPTGVKSVLKNDDDDDDDNPARLMVAAACACAEQAERNRGATTHVTPFFSPTLLTDRGRYGTHVTGTMDRGVVSESAALGRALADSQQKMFAPAALGASGVAIPTARGSTAPLGSLSPLVSPSLAARAAARHFSSDANAWLAIASQASPVVPFGPPFGLANSDGLRTRVASGVVGVAPFFDIATAGYDPLSVSMVPQRRVSADLPRDALASPGVAGSGFGFRPNSHTAPRVPANVPANVPATASRLKIEDAEDVLDEGSPRLRSPKASPRALVATPPRPRDGAVEVEVAPSDRFAPPAPAPAAPPAPASPAPPARDSGANGAATPSPDAEKDAEAAKAERREQERVRKNEKARADRARLRAKKDLQKERCREKRRIESAERRRLKEKAEEEKAEKASRELDEPNLPTHPTQPEEPVALLEMEDARRIIARLVDAAETEPGRDETASPTTPNADKTSTKPESRRSLRSASAPRAPRRLEAGTKRADETRDAAQTWTEVNITRRVSSTGRVCASDPVCASDREGSVREPPPTALRRPYVAPPRFPRVPAEASAKRSEILGSNFKTKTLSDVYGVVEPGPTAAPEPPEPPEPPAPAAKKPRILTGEDEKRDSTKRSRRSGTRRSGERKPKPNPNLEPNLEPNPEPGTASKPSKAPSRRVVSVSAPPKSANPSNPKKREAKARDPAAPLTMAPAPAGSIFDVIDAARAARDTASEQKRRASERARFEAKAYRCAVFECDREPMRDFFVTRHGAAGEVRESRFCEIALGVTPERLLRLRGTRPGAYFFKGEKTRALAASLSSFGERDATDAEATAFAAAFADQGGMVIRHFLPRVEGEGVQSAKKRDARETPGDAEGGQRTVGQKRERAHMTSSPSTVVPSSVDRSAEVRRGSRRSFAEKEKESKESDASEAQKRAAPTDTWTTWSGRRTTVRSVQPSQQQKRRIQKPAPDIGPWLASLRRAHKGESVSATCFYASQRVRPLFAHARAATPRLPKDETGNPIDAFSSGKNAGARTDFVPYYDSDDDAVAPSATLGVVEIMSRAFTDPAELLATPAEVAYLGVAPAKGSGTPLYAANASDAERLNARKTPKAPRAYAISSTSETPGVSRASKPSKPSKPETPGDRDAETSFYASVLSLDDVLFDAVIQGGEMMRDMRLAERETFSLMHNRSGMPLRFRYIEFDVLMSARKIEAEAQARARTRKEDTRAEKLERSSGDDERSERSSTVRASRRPVRAKNFSRFFGTGTEPSAKRDEPSHAWDPRSVASRPGNVARLVATTINHGSDSDHDGVPPEKQKRGEFSIVSENAFSETEKMAEKLTAPSLRFFAAGSAVPLRCARPFALSEVAFAHAAPARQKKRVYQTDTHTKKVLDATGFVWYTVPRRDVPKLARYVRALRDSAGAEAFSEQSSLLDGDDGYDARAPGLWLDPGALAKWNASRKRKDEKIVVQRHVQRTGEHFARAPGAARWGVCIGGCWLAETPFAFPEDYACVAKDAAAMEREAAFFSPKEKDERDGPFSDEKTFRVPRFESAASAETFPETLAAEALLEAAAAAAKGKD